MASFWIDGNVSSDKARHLRTLAHDDMLSAGEGLFPMLASAIEQAPQG